MHVSSCTPPVSPWLADPHESSPAREEPTEAQSISSSYSTSYSSSLSYDFSYRTTSRQRVLDVLFQDVRAFDSLPIEMRENLEMQKAAYLAGYLQKKHGVCQALLTERVGDEEFLLFSISIETCLSRFDKVTVDTAIAIRGDPYLKNEKIVAEWLVRVNGIFLSALDDFQDDDDIVRTAIQRKGYAIAFASRRIRREAATCLEAIYNDPGAFLSVGSELQNDHHFRESALRVNPEVEKFF